MNLEEILRQAAYDGVIECEDCGKYLESDTESCICGWKNPLV